MKNTFLILLIGGILGFFGGEFAARHQPQPKPVDYDALAKQYGAITPPPAPPGFMTDAEMNLAQEIERLDKRVAALESRR